MGALRAFDLLAVNRTVNQFDIYVGTSAGSFVASMVAGKVTPEEMFQVLDKALPSPIENPTLRTLLRPNYRGLRRSPRPPAPADRGNATPPRGNLGEISMVDVVAGLAGGQPAASTTTAGSSSTYNVLSIPTSRTTSVTSTPIC